METYGIAILGIITLMSIWIAVQLFWKKVFAEYVSDEDAMAERTKCSNCSCTTACKNKGAKQIEIMK